MESRWNLALLVLPYSIAIADAAPSATRDQPQAAIAPPEAYLGVLVGSVPPALTAQLPDTVPRGQGIMVRRIEPGSPAEAAGMRPYDLLLSYDDQNWVGRMLVFLSIVKLEGRGRQPAPYPVSGADQNFVSRHEPRFPQP